MAAPLKVIVGERFGSRTVLYQVDSFHGCTTVVTRCDCGHHDRIQLTRLKNGRVSPCVGCRAGLPYKGKPRGRPRKHALPELSAIDPDGYVSIPRAKTYTVSEWCEMMKKKAQDG